MSNYLTIAIALVSTVTAVSCIETADAVAEAPPIATVTIVDAEIEIISAPLAMVTVIENDIEIEYINFSE